MPAGYEVLFLDQGTTYNVDINMILNNQLPYDLSNSTAKAQIKKSYYNPTVIAEFVVTMPDPPTGVINISMDAETSANIAPGRYVYDVLMKDAANNVSRVVEGILNVSPQVTSEF